MFRRPSHSGGAPHHARTPLAILQVGIHGSSKDPCQCTKPGAAANERTQFAYYYLIGAVWNNGGKIDDCSSNHLNNCCYNELGDTSSSELARKLHDYVTIHVIIAVGAMLVLRSAFLLAS